MVDLPTEHDRDRQFARRITAFCVFAVAVLVAIIIIGPWEIDPHAENLLVLVATPGATTLGWLIGKGNKD